MSIEDEAQEAPFKLGPVTVVWGPEEAAEVSMVLQHVLHTMPDHDRLNQQQLASAHWLSEATLKVAAALVQAMKDAGLSDELIARATGNLQATPAQMGQMELVRNQAAEQMEMAAPGADPTRAIDEGDAIPGAPHPLDQPDAPTIQSPGVDFPADGGPTNG